MSSNPILLPVEVRLAALPCLKKNFSLNCVGQLYTLLLKFYSQKQNRSPVGGRRRLLPSFFSLNPTTAKQNRSPVGGDDNTSYPFFHWNLLEPYILFLRRLQVISEKNHRTRFWMVIPPATCYFHNATLPSRHS